MDLEFADVHGRPSGVSKSGAGLGASTDRGRPTPYLPPEGDSAAAVHVFVPLGLAQQGGSPCV
jgi:hypothetical protein